MADGLLDLGRKLAERLRGGATAEAEAPPPVGPGAPDIEMPTGFMAEIRKWKEERSLDERIWDICTLFLQGLQNQTLLRASNKRRFQMGQAESVLGQTQKSQFVFNKLLIPYRFTLSRLGVVYPSASVLPASPSIEDIAKAKAGEEQLRYFWLQEKIRRKWQRACAWMLTTGNVGLHTYFDPGAGVVRRAVVPPQDFFMEVGVRDVEESEWVAVLTRYKRDAVKKAYPEHADAIGSSPVVPQQFDRTPENRIEVFDVYFRDGRHGVLLGDTWLWKGTQPKGAEIPVTLLRHTAVEGRPLGIGLIYPGLDPQILYNEKRNDIADSIALCANPKVLIPDEAQVPANAFRRQPGEKVPYRGMSGTKPEYLGGKGPPPEAFTDLRGIEAEILDAPGTHSTSLGKSAINVESGRHAEVLVRNDVSQLQVTQEEMENAEAEQSRIALLLMKAHYTEERVIRMFDERGAFIYRTLRGTDLGDAPEIFIEAGSMFRDGVIERRAKALALFQAGVLPADEAAKEIAFGTANKYVIDKVITLDHARQMLDLVRRGRPIELFADDDFEAFESVWSEFMGSPGFYADPPAIQERVSAVKRLILAAKQAVAMQKAGMAAPGAPPTKHASEMAGRVTAGPQGRQPPAVGLPSPAGPPPDMQMGAEPGEVGGAG